MYHVSKEVDNSKFNINLNVKLIITLGVSNIIFCAFIKGPFKYYVIKEVGGWGQIIAIFDDLQYCKSSKRWVVGPKKVKNMMT